jgi:hypothetical protein
MSLARFTCAAGLALFISGCATDGGQPAPQPATAANAAFKTADFGWSKAVGKGRIDGQLTYSAAGKGFICGESSVVLTPETPWVRRRMMILYNSNDYSALPADEVRGRTPPERSQDYSAFVRRTKCDAANHFVFTDLPDGAWFVITVAHPAVPGAGRDIAIMRRVVVRNGQALKIRL